jgi:hypothetical protein
LLESGADYQGVSGTIRYQGKDHVPNKTVSIVAIRDRQASLAASWIPARVPRP